MTYHGFDDEQLRALGRVSVAMPRCELFAAMLLQLMGEAGDAITTLQRAGAANRLLKDAVEDDASLSDLAEEMQAVTLLRNRLAHDVGGVLLKQDDDDLVQVLFRTEKNPPAGVRPVPTAEQIQAVADRIEKLTQRLYRRCSRLSKEHQPSHALGHTGGD